MKCPGCKSQNTKKVASNDLNWRAGHQRCNDCGHQCHWHQFCAVPLMEVYLPPTKENK
jgi:hypothetical protein